MLQANGGRSIVGYGHTQYLQSYGMCRMARGWLHPGTGAEASGVCSATSSAEKDGGETMDATDEVLDMEQCFRVNET